MRHLAMHLGAVRGAMRRFVLTSLLALWAGSGAATELSGRVVSIVDGDTLTLLVSGIQQHRIRLAEIDAPEKGQPFGTRSRASLAAMCFGADAVAKVQTTDRYGRAIARIHCRGVDANQEQVKRGFAWVYDRYVTDRGLYVDQSAAQGQRVGLWGDLDPVPPWEFRRKKREKL